MKRSTSSSSDGPISSTFKRVKVSTSPGELRVERDMEHLLRHHHWNVANFNCCNNDPSWNGQLQQRGTAFELSRKNASLIRDPVDPLRMRLITLYYPPAAATATAAANSNHHHRRHSSTVERWVYHIRIPRMYPHIPPDIYRVSREVLTPTTATTSTDDAAVMHNHTNGLIISNHHTASRLMVASSVMQQRHVDHPPVPKQIVVTCSPPHGTNHFHNWWNTTDDSNDSMEEECYCGGDTTTVQHDNSTTTAESSLVHAMDESTAVYNQWSPVSSLGQLLDFLIQLPEQRRMYWNNHCNYYHHQQQQQQQRCSRSLVTPVNLPSVHSNNTTVQYRNEGQAYYRPSSPCDMEEDGTDTMTTTIQGTSSPFVANRFDVGYERRIVR